MEAGKRPSYPNPIEGDTPPDEPPTAEFPSSKGDGNVDDEPLPDVQEYIESIIGAKSSIRPRLSCPRPSTGRYEYLKTSKTSKKRAYFFALNIKQRVDILPRLLGSIFEAAEVLGPQNCVLSIVAGNSTDGTHEILTDLEYHAETFGLRYYYNQRDINLQRGDRISELARLRNLALQPLIQRPHEYDIDTTIVFLNDVAACSDDILELIHQRKAQNADMTCGMDWTYSGHEPTFYDV